MKESIAEALRRTARETHSPLQVAEQLDALIPGGVTQSQLITHFKEAFPAIPLRTILEAGGWQRVSDGGLSDSDFEEMLAPYIGGLGRTPDEIEG